MEKNVKIWNLRDTDEIEMDTENFVFFFSKMYYKFEILFQDKEIYYWRFDQSCH